MSSSAHHKSLTIFLSLVLLISWLIAKAFGIGSPPRYWDQSLEISYSYPQKFTQTTDSSGIYLVSSKDKQFIHISNLILPEGLFEIMRDKPTGSIDIESDPILAGYFGDNRTKLEKIKNFSQAGFLGVELSFYLPPKISTTDNPPPSLIGHEIWLKNSTRLINITEGFDSPVLKTESNLETVARSIELGK